MLQEKLPRDFHEQDWEQIAQLLPFRTGEQCMFKYLSMQRNRLEDHPWDASSEQYLYEMA